MNENRKALVTIVFISILGFFLIQLNKDSNKRANSSFNITENEIMNHIRFLSSENKKGRYPGSRESKDIISYLIKEFKSYGVKPIFENESFVQPFEIKSDIELGKSNHMIINDDSLKIQEDFIPLWFSGNGTVSGSCVFAGYGMEINEKSIQWNDYNNIDVYDKWVIVFRKSPEPESAHSPFTKHSSFHKKMLLARDKGAIGIIYISKIDDTELFPLKYVSGYTNDGIPAIHISNKTANNIFKPLGWSQEKLQETISRSMETINFEIPNIKIHASVNLNIKNDRAANVVGVIRSGNRKYRDEYIAIGAHFDHLGQGGKGSGSRQQELLETHPGADDNASGVSGLLEIAQKIASQKSRLKRSILLIGFDAEEKGLLGSKYFTENCPVPLENVVTMINLDMIGRMKKSTFNVGGVGTSPNFANILDSLSQNRDIKLKTTSPGFGPSDHASFYTKDIPVLFFFTGLHTDYHTPKDIWKLINAKGEKKILNFLYDFVIHLSKQSKKPLFTEAGPKTGQMSRNTQFKITLGVLPSYGSTKVGLEIDGISKKDGPAAKAGIKKGDIIKSIDGKIIKDIYEYMDRLSELEIGMTIPITIERRGKALTLSISF